MQTQLQNYAVKCYQNCNGEVLNQTTEVNVQAYLTAFKNIFIKYF